jgi:hypothetical protein
MADVLRPLALLELEAGLRFTPELMGSLVLDLGVGDAAPRQRAACRASTGSDCTAMALRLAFQLRYAFTPFAPATPWVALGVGGEATGLSSNRSSSSGDVIWSGVEFPRLAVGYDVRSSPTAGWGLFATAGIGRFDQVEDRGVTLDLSRRATHGWLQAGLRVILGP